MTAKRGLAFWFKIFASGILIAFLLTRLDVGLLQKAMRDMRWGWLAAGYGAIWTTLVLHTWRWRQLLSGVQVFVSFPPLFTQYLIGYFFGHFLPKVVGADTIRALTLAGNGLSKTRSLTVVLVGRVVGVTVVFISLIACVVLSQGFLDYFPLSRRALLGLGMLGLLSLVSGFLFLSSDWLNRVVANSGIPVRTAIETLRIYRRRWSHLLIAFLVSVLVQAATLIRHYFVAQSVGVGIDFATLSVVAILVMGITAVPVTINGLGLREGSFVFLLGYLGVPTELAFAFSIMNYVLMLAMAAVGGLVYMHSLRSPSGHAKGLIIEGPDGMRRHARDT